MSETWCETCLDLRLSVMKAIRCHMEHLTELSDAVIRDRMPNDNVLKQALEDSRQAESEAVLEYQSHLMTHGTDTDRAFA